MTVTRRATSIHLSCRTAGDGDGVAVPGTQLWVIEYTVREGRSERRLSTAMAEEPAARRMVANLLRDRQPGLSVEDVFTESLR